MADIFISYSRTDRKHIEPIAERLKQLGYEIWWDRNIVAGAAFVDDINRELDQARCVLVAWSRQSHNSTWVFGESLRGLETDRLVQIRIEPVRLNVPFNALNYLDVSGGASDEVWASIRTAIDQKLGEGERRSRAAEKVAPPPALQSARLISVISTAATIGLAVLVAIATAPLLPLPALQQVFTWISDGVTALPREAIYIAFGSVAALAGATMVLAAQRLWALLRAGG